MRTPTSPTSRPHKTRRAKATVVSRSRDGYSNNVDCESTTIERPQTTKVVDADLSIDKWSRRARLLQVTSSTGSSPSPTTAADPATNLVINDTLPAQFEVIGVFPAAGVWCTNTSSTVHCTATNLLIDQTVTVQVQVRVVAGAAKGWLPTRAQ